MASLLHNVDEVTTPSRILLLDDDEDMLDAVASLLDPLTGTRSLQLRSYRELVEHRQDALACELAILDVNLGEGAPSGVDAYRWLAAQRFAGRVVFLTGHGCDHPLVREASRLRSVEVLRKPVGLTELRQLVRESGVRAG